MALRCFLFSSDEETAARVRQILSDLGVDGEFCANAVAAVERITNQPFQIVIIDWDNQPEAGLLLSTARERKASERPITLAIVSNDGSVPQALQAGANSILRKPIVPAQAKDTLTTARDLLRAKQPSVATQAQTVTAAPPPVNLPAAKIQAQEDALRAGEFLVSPPVTPGGQFETEPEAVMPTELLSSDAVKRLKELEPTGGTVAPAPEQKPEPTPAPTPSGEGRGLDWYLKTRVAKSPGQGLGGARGNPELMGYDEPSQASDAPDDSASNSAPAAASAPPPRPVLPKPSLPPRRDPEPRRPAFQEQQHHKEAALFAYIDGGKRETAYEEPAQAGSFWGKKAIFAALALAGIATAAAPQAPWHPQLRKSWSDGQRALHSWLNPQPVTPAPAPIVHENLGARAGDEYKLPVAEAIPDATTDPSQIQVVPIVDPTLKKPNADATNPNQPAGTTPADGSTPQPAQPQGPDAPPSAGSPQSSVPPATAPAGVANTTPANASGTPSHPVAPVVTPTTMASSTPAPRIHQPTYVTPQGKVPSSLQSQTVLMTPDASGNKPPEAALPAIEPVEVPEATERALLTDQTAIAYPASAKGQQGVVVLDLLIGRDGTVQDAKFLQGSLMFARTAIDSVRQWKFKPYMLNGRPVQVETTLTVKFKPVQ